MGVMVSEIYDALINAGAEEAKARAAAEAVPISDQLATKQDISELKAELKADIAAGEANMWRLAITVAGLAVLINRFLDWVIPGK